jgi:threonylcarbamoyladenosine tRNA methylthiotransferase MtaB
MNDEAQITKTLKTVTLGCKVNQYETEYVRQGFERLGYRKAIDGEAVDLCIVNSCTVTAESEAKSRKIIRRLAKAHPKAEIIVMGCFATRAPDVAAALPGVVEVIADKRQLPGLLARRGLANVPAGIARFENRRRAYVKVQDGCHKNCSYCIVPQVRPHLSSRPAADVLDEVRRLLDSGHREIVLTGIHLGDYGREEEGEGRRDVGFGDLEIWRFGGSASGFSQDTLTSLLRQLVDLPGDCRIRLSSIEAAEVTPELVELMAERADRICPHLHVPLQSGSEAVLRRMNRRGTVREFVERCREIQAALDRPALTTDVIVGFPGETEADFAATCRVVEEVGFAKVHVFRFSPRQGTPAADMADQVCQRIAMQRAEQLGRLSDELQSRYLRRLIGSPLRVLVEMPVAEHPGWMAGTSDRHATVALPGGRELIGQFVTVTVHRLEDGWLWADGHA